MPQGQSADHAVERPDAQMAEEYFGGSDEDYDALNRRTVTNEAIDGDLIRYNEMQALADQDLSLSQNYELMQRYVDLDNLIDFFLIHQYTTNRDGPEIFNSNNQRAIGHRSDDPQFRFFASQSQNRFGKIAAMRTVDPTGSEYQVSAIARHNGLFAVQLAFAVNSKGIRCIAVVRNFGRSALPSRSFH